MTITISSASVTKLKTQLKAATSGSTNLMTRSQWSIANNTLFKITLPDGQYFKTAPQFTDTWGDPKESLTIDSSNPAIATYQNLYTNASYGLNIDNNIATVEPEKLSFKLTVSNIQSLKGNYKQILVNNIDVTNSSTTVEVANGEEIKLVAKDGNVITEKPYLYSPTKPAYLYFTISNSKDYATVTYEQVDDSESYNYSTIKIGAISSTLLYTITSKDMTEMSSQRVKMKINSVEAVEGSKIYYLDEIVCTTSDPWHFTKNSSGGASAYFFYNSEYEYHLRMLDDTNQSCGVTMGDTLLGASIISFNCVTSQMVETIGSNEVFKVTDEIIKKVNAARFSFLFSQGESTTVYDYGNYILSLMKIPFNIPADIVAENQNIFLADKDTGVSAPVVLTDLIKFSFGEIVVPKPESTLDYSNSVAVLHLPRTSSVALNLDYVLGQTIEVSYNIDVYKGLATVNISSTKINSTMITKTVDIGINIPVANTQLDAGLFNSSVAVGGDNGIYAPFIEILSGNSELAKGFFSAPILVDGNLENQYGVVRASDIKLNSKALKNEKEAIISILKSGVIINEPNQ